MPSPLIGDKNPYELLQEKVPTYSHFRIFGCLAYMYDKKNYPKINLEIVVGHVFFGLSIWEERVASL